LTLPGCEESSSSQPGRVKRYSFNGTDWAASGFDILGAASSNSGAGRLGSVDLNGNGKILIMGNGGAGGNVATGIVRVFVYCDSLIQQTDTIISCGPFFWNDSLLTSSGLYFHQSIDQCGCDSTSALNLSIEQLDTTVLFNNWILTAQQDTVSYQWIDCVTGDSLIGEIDQTFTPTSDGIYAAILSNGNCTDTTECINVIGTGSVELDDPRLVIYPNPATDVLYLSQPVTEEIEIVDLYGRMVYHKEVGTSTSTIHLEGLSAGLYFLRIDRPFEEAHKIMISE